MLSQEQNELVTQTGPASAAGAVLRRYWQPALLSEQLDGDRPVSVVRLLGEDLVAFRDPAGRPGLLARRCSHRGADLSFGRPEDGGLRCPFHGWLYDRDGRCLEQPAEPLESRFHHKISHPAYPCLERNGIIFAYLGDGPPPPLPEFDCFLAPDAFTLLLSIQLLLMVVVGGLGSMHGVIYGAIFIGLLPQGIAIMRDKLPPAVSQMPGLEPGIFGLILVLFLIYEPLGIYGRWRKVRQYFEEFPLYRKATYQRQKSYLRTERVR